MRRVLLLSVALLGLLALGPPGGARAVPGDSQLGALASSSNLHLARAVARGPRGGAAVRGPRGAAVRGPRGGGAVVGPRGAAVRGPRGGAAVRGPRGAAVRGPRGGAAVVGRRYYGGVWYGPRRRFWNGRWWPYGVGSCWRSTPIGFVWVCG
jgi:hypothetical protein